MIHLSAPELARMRSTPLVDPFGRAITYLRVSVTDRCDLRCTYCMSEQMTFLPRRDLLSLEELDRLCSAFVARGTGTGPRVRDWLARIHARPAYGRALRRGGPYAYA